MGIPLRQGHIIGPRCDEEPGNISGRKAVLTILSKAAEKAVEDAIVKHHQKGGKRVTAARVTIKPTNILYSEGSVAGETLPDLSYRFKVDCSKDEEIQPLLKDLCVVPSNHLPGDLPSQIDECTSALSHTPVVYSGIAQPMFQQQVSCFYCEFPRELTCGDAMGVPVPTLCQCRNLQYTIPTTHQNLYDVDGGRFSVADGHCDQNSNCPPMVYATHVSPAIPSSPRPFCNPTHSGVDGKPMDVEANTPYELKSGATHYRGRYVAPDIRHLVSDILKLVAMRRHYEEAGKSLDAWALRHRLSHGVDVTEEQALKENPHIYTKWRCLGRTVEKLQKAVASKVESELLKPLGRLKLRENSERIQPSSCPVKRNSPLKECPSQLSLLKKRLIRLSILSKQLHGLAEKNVMEMEGFAKDAETDMNLVRPWKEISLKLRQMEAVARVAVDSVRISEAKTRSKTPLSSEKELSEDQNDTAQERLMAELKLMSERCTLQQQQLHQLNKLNLQRLSELLKMKGRHRSICRVVPGRSITDCGSTGPERRKQESCIVTASLTKVSILDNNSIGRKQSPRLCRAVDFEFDRVYGVQESDESLHADLQDAFSATVMGRNLSIIAIGPPNSGKTSTLFFPLNRAPSDFSLTSDLTASNCEGIAVAFLFRLFEEVEHAVKMALTPGDIVAKVSCSCVECYQEELIDMFRVTPHKPGEKRPDIIKNSVKPCLKARLDAVERRVSRFVDIVSMVLEIIGPVGYVKVTNLTKLEETVGPDGCKDENSKTAFLKRVLFATNKALSERELEGRDSHVIFITCLEIADRVAGEVRSSKACLALISSVNEAIKAPFDCGPPTRNGTYFDSTYTDKDRSTFLTNQAMQSLRGIIQARKSVKEKGLSEKWIRESKLTRIIEDCLNPPALSILLLCIRSGLHQAGILKDYVKLCAVSKP